MRSRRTTCTAAAAVLLALTGSSNAGSADAGTHPRQAATPAWVTVSGVVHSSALPGVARLGGQLQVVWTLTQNSDRSIYTRVLAKNGAPASAILPVITGWPAIVNDPKVIGPVGTRRVVFAGIHPDPFSDYTGPAVFSESTDGTSWDLGDGSLSQSTAPGSGGEIAALDVDGVPFFAKGGFSGGVIVHRGVDPDVPATAPDFRATETQGAPVQVRLARDRATDDVYVAWFSLGATQDSDAGVFVQRMWPRPNGALLKAPGSSNGQAGAINPGQPLAVAERTTGGVWVAYRVGHPTSTQIRVWRVGAPADQFLTVNSPGATVDMLCLSTAPGGRLWLTWRTVGDHKLHATRTNKAATKFGRRQHLVQPGGLSTSVHATECEGSPGPLALIVNAQPVGESPRLYARRVLPALSAARAPAQLNKGLVTVTVTDAGDPIKGASVTLRGVTRKTAANGKASFTVPATAPARQYPIAVRKAGFAGLNLRVRVI